MYVCILNFGKGIIQVLMDVKFNLWIEDGSKSIVFDYVMNVGDLEIMRFLINVC